MYVSLATFTRLGSLLLEPHLAAIPRFGHLSGDADVMFLSSCVHVAATAMISSSREVAGSYICDLQ